MLYNLCQGFIILEPRPILTKIGETATFNCKTDQIGYPIDWYREVLGLYQDIYNDNTIVHSQKTKFALNYNTSDSYLSVHNITTDDNGFYTCSDYWGLGKGATAQLLVLMDDPTVMVTVNHTIVMNVTFAYSGEDTLHVTWVITETNGEIRKNIPQEEHGRDGLVNTSFIHTLKHIEKIQIQICGEKSGCFEKLYDGYHRHHHYHSSTSSGGGGGSGIASAGGIGTSNGGGSTTVSKDIITNTCPILSINKIWIFIALLKLMYC